MRRLLILLVVLCAVAGAFAGTLINYYAQRTPVSSAYGPNDFVMTWEIPNTNTVTVPARNGYTYNCTINWGDGTPTANVTAFNDADLKHSYSVTGAHQIVISGTFETIYFNNGGDKTLLRRIDQLGSTGWKTFKNSFWGCTGLTNGNCDTADVSGVTEFEFAWSYCLGLKSLGDLSGWDVSSVNTFASAWGNCIALKSLGDLSGWDVSSVNTFASAWSGNSALTTLGDLSGWDVSSVNTFASAWSGNSALTTLGDLSGWDVSSVTTFYYCWWNCSHLTGNVVMRWPSGLTTADHGWDSVDEVVGDISAVSNLAANCVIFGFYNTDGLTYSATNGAFSHHMKHSVSIDWRTATLSQSEVDNVLVDLDTSTATNGVVNLSGTGMSAPSGVGGTAKTNLMGKGWTVTVN